MLEGNGRKCGFLAAVVERLELSNVTIVNGRAETWTDGIGACDIVTARALAPPDVVEEYAAPLLKIGGALVAWRGKREPELEAAAARAAEILGLSIAEPVRVQPYRGAENRFLHVLTKTRETPGRFPPPRRRCTKAPARASLKHGGLPAFSATSGSRDDEYRPTIGSFREMGSIYAIANQKGGVGKTTTAVNLAACIAEAGYESLLIDIDPQCNATVGIGLEKNIEPNVYDLLSGEATIEQIVVPSPIEHLWVAPANPDLAGASVELPRIPGSETRLKQALAGVRDRYAFTLLDCPPSLGPLTINALVAADKVLVPVQAEYFALEGLAGLLETARADPEADEPAV